MINQNGQDEDVSMEFNEINIFLIIRLLNYFI